MDPQTAAYRAEERASHSRRRNHSKAVPARPSARRACRLDTFAEPLFQPLPLPLMNVTEPIHLKIGVEVLVDTTVSQAREMMQLSYPALDQLLMLRSHPLRTQSLQELGQHSAACLQVLYTLL